MISYILVGTAHKGRIKSMSNSLNQGFIALVTVLIQLKKIAKISKVCIIQISVLIFSSDENFLLLNINTVLELREKNSLLFYCDLLFMDICFYLEISETWTFFLYLFPITIKYY